VWLYPYDCRVTRSRWARWPAALGVISYTLYLTHIPIGTRVFNLGERLTGTQGLWWLFYAGMAFVVALGAGIVFFRYCESPWLNAEPVRSAESTAPLVPAAISRDGALERLS
jgi:peptidoglycan/LPS O-acetylase OafA/YrhL